MYGSQYVETPVLDMYMHIQSMYVCISRAAQYWDNNYHKTDLFASFRI